MSELPTDADVDAALSKVAHKFQEQWPDNSYGYLISRFVNVSQGTNWAVAVNGRAIGGAGGLAAFDEAIQAVHDRMPIIR